MYKKQSDLAPHKLPAIQRQMKSLELRKAGLSYAQIAEQLGYAGHQSARVAVKKALERTGLPYEEAKDILMLEIARTDQLSQRLWVDAIQGDREAIQLWIRLSERRTRLTGVESLKIELDHTVKQQVEVQVTHDATELLNVLGNIAGRIAERDNHRRDRAIGEGNGRVIDHPVLPARSADKQEAS